MIKLVMTFKRRRGMDVQAFRDYRRDVHTPILLSIPEAKLMRRLVVSYPAVTTAGAEEPRFDAMVEVWFDTEHDMITVFQSDGFRTKVDPDHANFVDPTSFEQFVTEEITLLE
ncbi:EthD domain-containing protein [Tropicimonas sp. IMCC34011]|uniref:EthD domain-containing protein n=1 Tax=Tropicimonas sp. IMCC34011 TaxID=2248759 RepID=UPI000E2721DF|nr:EthD domain-containing protein [Tropicimonas sp. IMCC34011]